LFKAGSGIALSRCRGLFESDPGAQFLARRTWAREPPSVVSLFFLLTNDSSSVHAVLKVR
jgi:hypothetical protein